MRSITYIQIADIDTKVKCFMPEQTEIQPELIVDHVLARWPETIPVFIKHGMACVGCDMSRFETIESAAGIYHIEVGELVQELKQAISCRL
jgi:hybrid cluster-associated redox disulfide protein